MRFLQGKKWRRGRKTMGLPRIVDEIEPLEVDERAFGRGIGR
jgi:hypothetical protein